MPEFVYLLSIFCNLYCINLADLDATAFTVQSRIYLSTTDTTPLTAPPQTLVTANPPP